MKDGKKKPKLKRNRVARIEAFSPDLDYEREKFLREEGKALADTVKTQEKIYRCVAINENAKALLKKHNDINAHLQEQIQAIEKRLEDPMPRSARILFLENHNKLMKEAIAKIGQIETELTAIEKDLYPTFDPKKQAVIFSRNKNAVAQLYARLKQHTFNIQFKLERIDPILRDSIQSDLELLKKLLGEIELITQKTSDIYERLKGGRIPPDLYATMANEVYEIHKKKFDFEQVCKLIEDKLEISKLDAEIKQKIEELKTVHEGLSAVKGIINTAYYNTKRGSDDLATKLKSVDFSFNATDYAAKLLTSSMEWDDDLTAREAIIKERQNLLAQLAEKKEYIAQVIRLIVTHQQAIKDLIAKDLDFCAKRASLYEAFTHAPHDFYQRYDNYQKALEYDFKSGLDNQRAQWYLHRLLTYTLGFSTDVPDNCVIVRHVRYASSNIKKLKVQFEKDFPLVAIEKEFFNYNGKSYFISDSIRKNIENYTSARAKISDAFKDENKSSEYVDFHYELQLLRESKTEIEQYIVAYEEGQKKNRLDLLDAKSQLSKSLVQFNLQNDSLEYQGEIYSLDIPTKNLVEQYNLAHELLTEALSDKQFAVDPISYKDKKEQFAALQKIQKSIIAYLEEQRKNRLEFLDFKEKSSNYTPLVLNKITLQENALSFQGTNYILDHSTQQMVERYNYCYESLAKVFNEFSSESKPLKISTEFLQKIRERFTQLEENQKYIIAYLEEQRTNRLEFLEHKEKFLSFTPFSLQGKNLSFQGVSYTLDKSTEPMVKGYNSVYTILAKVFSEECSLDSKPLTTESLKRIKEQFIQLEKNQKITIAFLEEQRKNRIELFLNFKEQFSNLTPFTVEENSLSFQGANYALDVSTAQMVKGYNFDYKILAEVLSDEISSESKPLTEESLQNIKKRLTQLEENKKQITRFVEKQRELDDLIKRFAAYSSLTITGEGNSLVYKEKTYPLNAATAKQIQEYNEAYEELKQAFKSENSTLDIESIKKLFNKLQQRVKPFDQIEEFGKLTKLLEQQSELVSKRKIIVQQIIDNIDLEFRNLGDVAKGSEEEIMSIILASLLQVFACHQAEVEELATNIGIARNDLCLDNLNDSKEQLKRFASANHDKAGVLVNDLREEFNENLPKFSSNKRLNQFMEWIDKHILAPLYEAYYKEEKPYKPGFFASSIERNLFEFRKNLFPDLEKFQNELSEAAAAASAA